MKKKILLIEDNADVRENTGEILQLAGYNVLTAVNGKAGVELALHGKPDLIICDIMMPELDGYGVLHILNKNPETSAIPFIFLTARSEKYDMRKGMNLGADDYLTKPFDDGDLLDAIDARLRKAAIQYQRYESTAEGLETFINDARQVLNLKDLCKDKKVKIIKKKAELFSEGDSPVYVYFVKSGSVKAYQSHPDGKELITNIYSVNDFIGFEAVLEDSDYKESAVALEDTEVIAIPVHDFNMLLQMNPDVSRTFISLLCKKIADREKQLLNLAYNSIRQRTAQALLKVVGIKDANNYITIGRDDLARIVGTASESVIRVLHDFKDERLIEIEGGRIRIVQPAKLESVVRWNFAK